MTESPDTGKRYGSALASVFGTLPRRSLIIAGFAVLGWISLALLGTSSASAAPDHGAVHDAASAAPDHGAVHDAASAAPDHGAAPDAAGAAPDHGAVHDAASASVPLLGTSLSEVTQPVVAAAHPVAEVAAPLTQLARPVTATAARLTDEVAPATTSLTKALAPVTSVLPKPSTSSLTNNPSGLLPTLARSADELSGEGSLTSSDLLPILSRLLGVGAAPAPGSAPVAPAPVAPVPATSGGHSTVRIDQTTSSSTSRPADESRPAMTGPASAMHGPLAGIGVPALVPAVPPAGPDTLLVAGAGLTVTTSSGPGGSSAAGCNDELARQADLRPVGTADSARTRPVRNSATEPPVSPD